MAPIMLAQEILLRAMVENAKVCISDYTPGPIKAILVIHTTLMFTFISMPFFYFVKYSKELKDEFWCKHLNDLEENCKHEREKKHCPVKCCPYVNSIENCRNTGNK